MEKNRGFVGKMLIAVVAIALFSFTLIYCMQKEAPAFSEQETEFQSYFEDIRLCGYSSGQQEVKLFQNEEGTYHIFMPCEMRTDVYVQFDEFKELQIGDVVYNTGDALTDIYKNEPYTIMAKDWAGNTVEEGILKFYFSVEIPSIYIESATGNLDEVHEDKNVRAKAQFTTVSELGGRDASGECIIKARGNTSFQSKQKSYSLNLTFTQSLLGMSAASEWALLANYNGTIQQLKNKVALDITAMIGMEYTPESRFVNVYIDNQYNGLYLLTQKVSTDGGSVRIDNLENGRSNITGAYLMEFDSRYEEEPVWFLTETEKIVLKSPKDPSEEKKNYIASYMLEAEKALFSEDGINSDTGKSYLEYFDLDSWASMYLMQEFFVQWDVEFASFYLYKLSDDSHLYAGPIWDFDLAFGEMYPGYYPQLTQKTLFLTDCRDGWLAELSRYPEFQKILKAKYTEVFSPVIDVYLEERFDELVSSLKSSSYMNEKRWNRGDAQISTDAEQLKFWIINRKEFLDEYSENSELFHKAIFKFKWGRMSYYVKDGDALGFLPSQEFGEMDYLGGKVDGYDVIVGWQNSEDEPIDAEMIITESVEFCPIYEE